MITGIASVIIGFGTMLLGMKAFGEGAATIKEKVNKKDKTTDEKSEQ